MKKRARLAAGLLALAAVTGAGAAAAAPAYAAEGSIDIKYLPTKGICEAVERASIALIIASGNEVYAGDSCHYRDAQQRYGFMVYYR